MPEGVCFDRVAHLTMAPQANDRTDERIRAATFEAIQGGMSLFLPAPRDFFPREAGSLLRVIGY